MKRFHLVPCLALCAILSGGLAAYGQSITATPSSISMSGQAGGTAVTQTVSLTATSPTQVSIAQNPPTTWLSVSASIITLSSTPTVITLAANPAGLQVGTYSTSLLITGGSGLIVPITFSVGSVGVSPGSLSFTYQPGGQVPPAQSLTLISSATTSFTAVALDTTWLQLTPTSGNTPGPISVQLNPARVATLAVGTYSTTIVITPGTGGSVSVPVTLTVGAVAQVSVNPSSVNFFSQVNGTSNVTQQALTLSTNSAQAVPFAFTSLQVGPNPAGQQWFTVSPTSGAIPANGSVSVTVTLVSTITTPGTYTGSMVLSTTNASPTSQTIQVNLTVSTFPLLNVPAAQINFVSQAGTAAPPAQTVTPTSTGAALQYTVAFSSSSGNWLTVSPVLGTTPNPISLTANPAGLAPGTYTGTVTVTPVSGAGNGAQQFPVSLVVSNDAVVATSVKSLVFAYQTGQAQPALQSVRVSSSTGAALTYTATPSASWIVLGGQSSGVTDGTFTVQANPAGLTANPPDGTITITAVNPTTGAAVANSPLTISVRLYVSSTPLLVGSPASVAFTAQVGGASPQQQQVVLTSTSATDQITFSVSPQTDNGGGWLFVVPSSTSTPSSLSVSVLPSLLSAGTYTGSIRVTATGAAVANSPLVIPVTLTMTSGTLAVTPASLTFSQAAGGAKPAAQTLQISATGSTANYSVAVSTGGIAVTWLSATPVAGSTPGTVTVSADGTLLSAGTYQGSVTVTAPGVAGSPVTVPVTFTVGANSGTISAAPASLSFSAAQSGSAPASQTISVTGSAGALSFTTAAATSSGGNWLSVTPASGTSPGTLTVSVNQAGLALGTYNGTITVTAPGATGSPLSIPVTLTVGNLARGGVLTHIAAGGGWTTVISLINTSTAQVTLQVLLRGDDGNALGLPVSITQRGAVQTVTASSLNAVLSPNETVLISTGGQSGSTQVGWADVQSSGPVNGYAIFRQNTSSGTASEGTAPLQTQITSKLVLPFDNTTGYVTGVALANLSSFGTVTATVYGVDGTQLGSQPITIAGNGHTSFSLPERLPLTAGRQGIVVFQSTGGNGLTGLGLRFSPSFSFTSVPTIISQ